MSSPERAKKGPVRKDMSRRGVLGFIGFALAFPRAAAGARGENLDADLTERGNADFIEEHKITVTHEDVFIGPNAYRVTVCERIGTQEFSYLVLHDSEDAAFDAALRGISDGGIVIKIANAGRRYLQGQTMRRTPSLIDPNRIFGAGHSHQALANKILDILRRRTEKESVVLSMHNSRPGGDFNLSYLAKSRSDPYTVLWRPDMTLPDKDPHNMIIITGLAPEPSPYLKDEIEWYISKGCNIVYEYAKPPQTKTQLSFSEYAIQNGIVSRTIDTRRGERGNIASEQKARKTAERYRNAVRAFHTGKNFRADRQMLGKGE